VLPGEGVVQWINHLQIVQTHRFGFTVDDNFGDEVSRRKGLAPGLRKHIAWLVQERKASKATPTLIELPDEAIEERGDTQRP
jgi:hypothetical protein